MTHVCIWEDTFYFPDGRVEETCKCGKRITVYKDFLGND